MAEDARAVPVKTESWNRSIYLFRRIIRRKTASHFCWKCSKIKGAHEPLFYAFSTVARPDE
ncbi:hypothetical protein FGI60_04780 [Brucella haematophila]|nr:hypothetical protein FGI60_04780 [Brucella haematophila]